MFDLMEAGIAFVCLSCLSDKVEWSVAGGPNKVQKELESVSRSRGRRSDLD